MSVSADTAPYLAGDGGPDFERVVIRATDNEVTTELQARDHVVIVTFQHLQRERQRPGFNDTESMFTYQIHACQLDQCDCVPWAPVCLPSSSCSLCGVV